MILLEAYSFIDTELSLLNIVNKICDIFKISAKFGAEITHVKHYLRIISLQSS